MRSKACDDTYCTESQELKQWILFHASLLIQKEPKPKLVLSYYGKGSTDCISMITTRKAMGLEALLLISFAVTGSSFTSAPQHHLASLSSPLFASSKWEEDNSRPYVPDGLTADQYSKILKKEQTEQSQKDFGSFGPRFMKAERPDGDWLLMKGLWTNGFNANSALSATGGGNSDQPSKRSRFKLLMRKYGASFLLSYVVLDAIIQLGAMWRASQITVFSATFMATRFLLFNQNHIIHSGLLLWKMQVIKVALSGLLTVPVHRYVLERVNRRWSWTPRRVVVTTATVATGLMLIAGLLLMGLRSVPSPLL